MMNENQASQKVKKKYYILLYTAIILVALVVGLFAYSIKGEDNYWYSFLLNFSTELFGASIISIILGIYLYKEWELATQVQNLLSEIQNSNEETSADNFFNDEFLSHKIDEKILLKAKSIYYVGYSLTLTINSNKEILKKCIRNGTNIRFLILNPNSPLVVKQIAERTTEDFTEELWKDRLGLVIKEIRELIRYFNHTKVSWRQQFVELRFLNYIPSFGIVFIDYGEISQACYPMLYPHITNKYGPAFKLNPAKAPNSFINFKSQYDVMWNSGLKSESILDIGLSNLFFKLNYMPDNLYDKEFEGVTKISLLGYSLSRVVRSKSLIIDQLMNDGVDFQFLVIDPENQNIENQISYRTPPDYDIESWKYRINLSIEKIKRISSNKPKSNVELKKMPYIPSFGLMILEKNGLPNLCFVIIYPNNTNKKEAAFKLNQKADSEWYTHFSNQYSLLWENSEVVN